jgi:hypothetical protein
MAPRAATTNDKPEDPKTRAKDIEALDREGTEGAEQPNLLKENQQEEAKAKTIKGRRTLTRPGGGSGLAEDEDAPLNVYLEKDDAGNPFVWYTTPSGKEVGRKPVENVNEFTKVPTVTGYDFDTEATSANIDEIASKAVHRTQFYIREGGARITTTLEDFKKRAEGKGTRF